MPGHFLHQRKDRQRGLPEAGGAWLENAHEMEHGHG